MEVLDTTGLLRTSQVLKVRQELVDHLTDTTVEWNDPGVVGELKRNVSAMQCTLLTNVVPVCQNLYSFRVHFYGRTLAQLPFTIKVVDGMGDLPVMALLAADRRQNLLLNVQAATWEGRLDEFYWVYNAEKDCHVLHVGPCTETFIEKRDFDAYVWRDYARLDYEAPPEAAKPPDPPKAAAPEPSIIERRMELVFETPAEKKARRVLAKKKKKEDQFLSQTILDMLRVRGVPGPVVQTTQYDIPDRIAQPDSEWAFV